MMKKFISVILLVSVLVMSCSTTVKFTVYDEVSGNELTDYTIQIEGKTLHYGETIRLSNAAWREYNAIVRKDGYTLKQVHLKKEIKIAPLVIGYLFILIPLLWCYGPDPNQTFILVRDN